MAKMLVCYYTRTGNTKKMAEAVAEGAAGVAGVEVETKVVSDVPAQSLKGYDAIVIGSPVYYGSMAAELKKLIDDSAVFHGALGGKVGGAFASSGNIGGGNETTIMSILRALIVHGMVVQGDPRGSHYGPVSINAPDEQETKQCIRYGKIVGELAVKLHG